MYIRLVQDFGLECEVAQHLAKSYGDRAFAVAKMAALTGKSQKYIHKNFRDYFVLTGVLTEKGHSRTKSLLLNPIHR